MDQPLASDRRAFLKSGAVLAAPLAMAAPVAAFAADDSRARLARLEDERAIEALHRRLMRHANGAGDDGALFAADGSADLGAGLSAIAEDMRHEPSVAIAEDGLSATARCFCRVERDVPLTGNSTVERMTRFQGQGSHRLHEERVLATRYIKQADGWRIADARFA